MMLSGVLLLLLLLCGAGRGADFMLHTAAVERLQQSAVESAALYLPVGVSPTSPCGKALGDMATALQANTSSSLWAKSFVDSWGKTTDGQFLGHKFNGMYDECLSAASPDGSIKGKHCRIFSVPVGGSNDVPSVGHELLLGRGLEKLDFSFLRRLLKESRANVPSSMPSYNVEYDTCMPNVCTQGELQNSLVQYLLPNGAYPTVLSCADQETEAEFTDADVGFMSVFTFLLVVVGCASLIDMYLLFIGNERLAKGALRYLLVFSAYTNLSKLFQVNTKSSPGSITCLHAMRTMSMVWVIWCHQQTVPLLNMANILLVLTKYDNILAQAIINGYPSVDSFFFLSGLLVSYSVLREAKRTGSFNILLFYFHRLIRLVPSICIVGGFCATVAHFFVAGPLTYVWTYYWQPTCIKNWWKDVVFVDNFLYESGSCLGQAWYLAADMQLYLVAPLIILPLYFFKGFGKAWLFLLTALSAIIPAAIIYKNNLPPTALMGIDQELANKYMKIVYFPPWTRASPWLAGAWVGYIFFRQGNTRYKMNALIVTVGWTLAAITGLLVVFGMYSYNNLLGRSPYELMTQLVYGGGHRLAWGAVLAWVVFACHNSYGGLVDGFLSHPVWQPVSRLTYTTYLVAVPLQNLIYYNTARGGAFYFTHINTVISTVASVTLTIPCAVLVSLLAESPIVGLEKLLLRPNHGASPRKPVGGEKNDLQTPTSPPFPGSNISTIDTAPAGYLNPVFTLDGGVREAGKEGQEAAMNGDAATKSVPVH